MKTLLKLVIALALLHAVARGGLAAWDYYQLKDAADRALLFGSAATNAQIHGQILERATELGLPLDPESLRVRWQSGRRLAEGSYTQQVELLPSYRYPVEFSFTAEAMPVGTPPPDDEYPPAR